MQGVPKLMAGIKSAVQAAAPGASVILFGSYARGDNSVDSDIDLLVLLDSEKVTYDDRVRITHSLFPLELESGIHISPLLRSRRQWEDKQVITPFYRNVIREGILL